VLTAHWMIISWALGVSISDMMSRRIPNVFSLGAMGVGLAYLAYAGSALVSGTWLDVLLGVLLAILLTLPAYLMRWLGAADVKLLLAIASLGGWKIVLSSFAVAGMMSGISALIVVQYAIYSGRSPESKRWLPFGAMLATGLIISIGVKA